MRVNRMRKVDSKELERLQRDEKIRNNTRRKMRKKGKSITTDKSKTTISKSNRPSRKITKKRSAIR